MIGYKEVLMARKNNARSTAEKAVKKAHPVTLILAVLFLIIGIIAGVLVFSRLTENDKFVLNGDKEIRLAVGEDFEDPGATVISFGRDISAEVIVAGERDLFDPTVEGVYQFLYTVEDVRWGNYQLVRTVIVGNPDDGGSQEGAAGVEE